MVEVVKGTPNGILGIRLHEGVKVPESLQECGAEIIDWNPDEFEAAMDRAAMDRAAMAAGRARVAAAGPGGGSRCIR